MKPFLLALQFFSVITLKSDLRCDARDLARSRAWYGPVGAVLGLGLGLVAWLLSNWLPQPALAGVVVICWAVITRFLHLDGVADSADALVHTTSRERALEIMKDTRLGSFGVAAIACVLLAKFSALASLGKPWLVPAVIIAPGLARSLAGGMGGLVGPARPGQGLGGAVATEVGYGALGDLLGVLFTVLFAILVAGSSGLAAALANLVWVIILGLWFRRRVGGVTGDNLGFAIETGECIVLMIMAMT